MECSNCRHENPAGAGFCENCGARIARQCAACGAALSASAKFCPNCGAPVTAAQTSPARYGSPDAYTPRHLAERILTSRAALEGERKQVTVLFADMKGSMELLADRDPEDARKLLDPALERMMEAVHRYEGTVNQVMGDGIMALFGAPLAHEDHAARACYAALRMQHSVKEYAADVQRTAGVPIQIRVGLNSGEVVVRSIGSDLRMDYSAVGQTVHLAARMEQMAMGGSILLTAATLRLAEDFIDVRAIGPATVKGLAEPVEVYEARGAGTARRRFEVSVRRGLTRFVGRTAELGQLRKALNQAAQGHGQAVAVVGEPGVGKTRLFHEFVHSHRTAGWTLLASGSDSHGKATPYLPVIELLKAYFHIEPRDDIRRVREKVTGKLLALDRALEGSLPALFALLDVPVADATWTALDPPHRRSRTLEACKRLLLRESQMQPLLVVFEDLHWVDADTQAFLDSLVDSLPAAHVLLLLNYRPEYRARWAGKAHFTQLRVEPFGADDVDALLNALLGRDPSVSALKPLLVARTEGNAFFLEESIRSLVESGALAGQPGAWCLARPVHSINVPATVQAVLAARIDRLPPAEKRLLQEAAVVGHDVPMRVLHAVSGLPDEALRDSLGGLQDAEFLYETVVFPEPEYSFKHALTHDVAYESLLAATRQALHARAVAALEEVYQDRLEEHAEALARHAIRGENWEKAVDYLRQAATAALARGAVPEFIQRSEQALELCGRLPETPPNLGRVVDARLDLSVALTALGQVARVGELVEQAEPPARQLGDELRFGRIAAVKAYFLWFSGRYRESLQVAAEALRAAAGFDDPELRIRARTVTASAHGLLGEYRAAIAALEPLTEGADVEEAKRMPSAIAASFYVASCGWRGLWHASLGEFREAELFGDLAIQYAETLGVRRARASAYVYRGWACSLKDDIGTARSLVERALDLSNEDGLVYWISISSVHLGALLAQLGRVTEALEHSERGMQLQAQMGTKVALASLHGRHALTLLLAGRPQQARAEAERALTVARAMGERTSEVVALNLLGRMALEAEPHDVLAAETLLDKATRLAEALGARPLAARCLMDMGRLHARCDRAERAMQSFGAAAALCREMGIGPLLAEAEKEMAAITAATGLLSPAAG